MPSPHLWATTLFDEVVELGYAGSYQSSTRAIRARSLRPRCQACRQAKTGDRALIEHPPGEETQWDWLAATRKSRMASELADWRPVTPDA